MNFVDGFVAVVWQARQKMKMSANKELLVASSRDLFGGEREDDDMIDIAKSCRYHFRA